MVACRILRHDRYLPHRVHSFVSHLITSHHIISATDSPVKKHNYVTNCIRHTYFNLLSIKQRQCYQSTAMIEDWCKMSQSLTRVSLQSRTRGSQEIVIITTAGRELHRPQHGQALQAPTLFLQTRPIVHCQETIERRYQAKLSVFCQHTTKHPELITTFNRLAN
jgi:hypothetical protein